MTTRHVRAARGGVQAQHRNGVFFLQRRGAASSADEGGDRVSHWRISICPCVRSVWVEPQLSGVSLPGTKPNNICLHFWLRFQLFRQLLGTFVHILWPESVLIPVVGGGSRHEQVSSAVCGRGHVTTPLWGSYANNQSHLSKVRLGGLVSNATLNLTFSDLEHHFSSS